MSRDKSSRSSGVAESRRQPELHVQSGAEAGLSNSDLCEFYKEHWARPIALERVDFTDWQMNGAPCAGGANHSVVAIEGDDIVAVMGCTPIPFRIGDDILSAAALTTWVVAPASRGKGIGKSILAYLQQRYDVLTGAGITTAALPLYLSADFTFLAHIPRFFHIADFGAARDFTPISEGAQRITQARQAGAPPVEWCAARVPAADLAPHAAVFDRHNLFLRDAPHLDWRYDRHPAFRYEAFSISDRHAPGLGAGLVLRQDAVEGRTFLHIIDLFGDLADLPAALAFAEAEAVKRGAAFVDMSATSGTLSAILRARGWSSSVDDPLIELPSLFYPVELRRPPTTSVVVWSRVRRMEVYDLSRLHVSRGDMDLDRPTMAWYDQNGE